MALVVEVKVVPSAGKSECILDKKGSIKCFLKSAPEHGKANAELIKLLAKLVGVVSQDVHIILGALQRKKTVRIDALLTRHDLLAKLQGDVQQSLFHQTPLKARR